jgi:hypothetical protein
MATTASFIRQHDEILAIAAEISSLLQPEQRAKDANQVRSKLSRLAGNVTMHLTVEDQLLYPNLLNHEDDKVRALTAQYVLEMGKIAADFKEYLNKWFTPRLIQEKPNEFVKEKKTCLML